MKLVRIVANKLTMGSPDTEKDRDVDEGPHRQVTLTKPFYMGATEVTRGQFAAFVADSDYKTTADKEGRAYVHGKASCRKANQENHWGVLQRTVVEPTLGGTKMPALSEVCTELDIESETKASNMRVTVVRRFRPALRLRVRQFIDSYEQIDEEIQDLRRILSHTRAGSSELS